MIIMVTPIDLTDINSVEDAKNALQTWNISKEKAEYITQALLWMEWLENKLNRQEKLINSDWTGFWVYNSLERLLHDQPWPGLDIVTIFKEILRDGDKTKIINAIDQSIKNKHKWDFVDLVLNSPTTKLYDILGAKTINTDTIEMLLFGIGSWNEEIQKEYYRYLRYLFLENPGIFIEQVNKDYLKITSWKRDFSTLTKLEKLLNGIPTQYDTSDIYKVISKKIKLMWGKW